MRSKRYSLIIVAACFLGFAFAAYGDEAADKSPGLGTFLDELDMEVHGFYEMRAGYRTYNDKYEKDMSIMENRLQLDVLSYMDWGDLKFRGDVYGDMVTEEATFDLREAWVMFSPLDFMDVKAGRQILTWGTGDLIFINDMFPKDWQSFFIGRDDEYLKGPSDAIKASFFTDVVNFDIVFTPLFNPDNHIRGERISYWNPMLARTSGEDAKVHTDRPNKWFTNAEFATRVYKTVNNYELAFYTYHGYWKTPGGMNVRGLATYPNLNVYGASIQGNIGKGIGNIEVGYYDSAEDRSGKDPMVNNSEMRYLIGYTQEIGKDLTGGIQYYVEQMLGYSGYRRGLVAGLPARDEYRHLVTFRLTKLLMNQNLRVGLFAYYSPTDQDAYLRPKLNYKVSDNFSVELGANVFMGDYPHTFFGQFEHNTNIYTAFRISF